MGEATESLRRDIEETKADLSERIEVLAERAGRAVDVNYQTELASVGDRSRSPWELGLVLGYLTSTPDGRRPREESWLPAGDEPSRYREPGVMSSIAAHAVGGVLRDLARRTLGG